MVDNKQVFLVSCFKNKLAVLESGILTYKALHQFQKTRVFCSNIVPSRIADFKLWIYHFTGLC